MYISVKYIHNIVMPVLTVYLSEVIMRITIITKKNTLKNIRSILDEYAVSNYKK